MIRLLDANSNRAREALRTLEDLSRFHLDDQALCARAKHLRHALQALIDALPIADVTRLDARRIESDVGTGITEARESRRADVHAIAAAAGGRLTESLRVLEEAVKSLGAPASAFESLRYEAYALDRDVRLALKRDCPQWKVCLLLTESICLLPWRDVLDAALDAGVPCVQVREKEMASGPLLERAHEVRERTRAHDAALIVNDRPDIAMLCGADGVHVGQDDLDVPDVRRVVGSMWVGVSTSGIEQARRAVEQGASYCGLGPMFPSTTKPRNALSGPAYLQAYLADEATRSLPHLAISGITVESLADLPGCRGVAVSGAICAARDPGGAARRLLDAID